MSRAARRRGDPRKRPRQLVFLLAGVVAVLAITGGIVFALVSGGDDSSDDATRGGDGTPGNRTPSTSGTRGGPEPVLNGPAVKYAASEQEIGGGIEALPSESTDLTLELFADPSFGPFKDSTEGKARSGEWGYAGGYVGSLQPDGLAAGVVLGRYYVRLETHLFQTTEGASRAYAWYADQYGANQAVDEQEASPLGNESSGWKGVLGKVGSTELDRVFHRFVFRRGNLVAMVETVGADTFMTIDPAREIGVVVDERALGNRAAPTPTPGGGAVPPPTVR